MSQFFASGGQNIGISASTSVPPMNTQDWSPLGWTGWISLKSKGLSRVFSNTTVQKHQFTVEYHVQNELKIQMVIKTTEGLSVLVILPFALKSKDFTLPTKVCLVKTMVFPVVMYGCESWTIKKAECWRTDAPTVLEKTLESLLDCKEIQPVHPKGDQSWVFIGRTTTEAEASILWPPDAKNWLIGKNPDVGKIWRQEENGVTEDETVGWHHWLNGREFEQVPGVGGRQGSLACYNPWGCK